MGLEPRGWARLPPAGGNLLFPREEEGCLRVNKPKGTKMAGDVMRMQSNGVHRPPAVTAVLTLTGVWEGL